MNDLKTIEALGRNSAAEIQPNGQKSNEEMENKRRRKRKHYMEQKKKRQKEYHDATERHVHN